MTSLEDHEDYARILLEDYGDTRFRGQDRLLGTVVLEVIRLRERVEELEKKTWLD